MRNHVFAYAKTKALISCAISAQLISAFVNTFFLLPIYESISSVSVQPGLCKTWSETTKKGFLVTRLIVN